MNKTLFSLFLSLIILSASCVAKTASTIKPFALKEGDTVAIVAPASHFKKNKLYEAVERLKSLGLKPIYDETIFHQYGYFAGTEKDRADAINKAIRNDKVKAIFALKGGYGTANLLDKIDYNYLSNHPKIIIGRSDITALLIAVYTKSHLITFYGPSASVEQSQLTLHYEKNILFQNQTNVILNNDAFNPAKKDVVSAKYPVYTITPGIIKGQFIGGNLSVLVSLIGTPYFPKDWHGTVLFLEDVNENIYVIDRMLGQLKNAGVLDQISGFVFGTCTKCKYEPHGGFQLQEVIDRYIKPLNIPAYSGAMIGHQEDIYTVPIGSIIELDANKKQITLIESPTLKE